MWRRFDRQGFLLEQTDYRKEPAQREVYDSFGTLRAQGALKKGLKQGVWRVFDATELKREEGAYKDGRRDGLWRFWNADGKPLAKGEFDQGRRVGPWRYDHPEGGNGSSSNRSRSPMKPTGATCTAAARCGLR